MADLFDAAGASLADELTSVSTELDRISTLADGVGRALSNGFSDAILKGKSFRSVLGDIAKSIADIALKAALKPVANLTSTLIESLFAATNPSLTGVTAFASGGVVAAPTFFPLGQGLGVAGEAGPEAILPLRRGSDGRLGVATAGTQPISVSFNVQASDAKSFVAAEAEVSAMLLRAVRRGTRAS